MVTSRVTFGCYQLRCNYNAQRHLHPCHSLCRIPVNTQNRQHIAESQHHPSSMCHNPPGGLVVVEQVATQQHRIHLKRSVAAVSCGSCGGCSGCASLQRTPLQRPSLGQHVSDCPILPFCLFSHRELDQVGGGGTVDNVRRIFQTILVA